MQSFDVVVVGLGAMGSATLCHLAELGHRVLGIEQFQPGHALGSSHGDSRIIREQYFEHPLYVPLVQRAYDLWQELEERSGERLMTITGGLMIGPPDGMVVTGTIRSATTHHLPYDVLDPTEVSARYPAFRLADGLVAALDPRCGFLDPEACNAAHIDAALRAGAEAHFEERVVEWRADGDGVRVDTSAGSYLADRLVISAGAWTSQLLDDLKLPLTVERQVAFWLEPEGGSEQYDQSRFPIYAYEFTPGLICYGFPRLPRGVKVSIMHGGETAFAPEDIRRVVDEDEISAVRAALTPVLPDLIRAPVRENAVCLFTNTPDHDFIIDFHPEYPQVLVSSPCSGHGFKFASVLGEIQASLVTGGTPAFDMSPFRIGRFSEATGNG
jgi:sarcosine oxidase